MKLYIDPGTGSLLFAFLIGIFGAIRWLIKKLIVDIRFIVSGGKPTKNNDAKIPLVIFSDNKRYWNVFKPICDELEKRNFDTVYMTCSLDDPIFNNSYKFIHPKFIGEGNKAFATLNFLNATILLSTTPGLEVYQWKRSKNVNYYVHILHTAAEVTAYRMFGIDYYDAVLVSGEYQIKDERKLEELRHLPKKELIMVGIPYMDEMKKRLLENPPITNSIKTILVAPSWGKNGILNKYKDGIIKELLKTDYHIIIRPHPQSFISEKELLDELMNKYPSSDKLEWNNDVDNFEVLKRSDLLISDFSGVIFDYSLVFDKSIIYADTEFDSSIYDICWLDTPFWTFTALPRIGEKLDENNLNDLPQIIEQCLTNQKYINGIEEVKKETWCYQNEGSKRTVDYLISKYEEISKIKEIEK